MVSFWPSDVGSGKADLSAARIDVDFVRDFEGGQTKTEPRRMWRLCLNHQRDYHFHRHRLVEDLVQALSPRLPLVDTRTDYAK